MEQQHFHWQLLEIRGNRDIVNILLDKAESTTDKIEKTVVTSCYGGHPTLIIFHSNKRPHITNDQRDSVSLLLLIACNNNSDFLYQFC